MQIRVGIENNVEGRSMAWALDHPGCFSYGRNADEALSNLPDAIFDYFTWIDNRRGEERDLYSPLGQLELSIEDSWDVYIIDENYEQVAEGYEVNAWFRRDWKPLSVDDIEAGMQILSWSRDDLLAIVESLTQEQMAQKLPGERWDIFGILRHIGGAEWWYLDRLGLAFPQVELPKTPFERLERSRAHLQKVLPSLVGKVNVVGIDGEFWSPRKLLRRAAWHERDHIQHISQLMGKLEF